MVALHFDHGIHRSADERKRHLGELQRTQVAAGYPAQFNFLYQSLGILDSKASALLTFNGITLAALATAEQRAGMPTAAADHRARALQIGKGSGLRPDCLAAIQAAAAASR